MLDARSKQTFLVVFKIRFLFTFLFLPTCQYSLAEAEHPPVQTNALPLAVPEQTDCDFIAQGLMWYQNFAVPLKMLDTDKVTVLSGIVHSFFYVFIFSYLPMLAD
jgi:hypothetical protein